LKHTNSPSTNFLSKEAPLAESIANMKSALAGVGCETTFSQEKHPLEHCYSVNLASVEAPAHLYSNGKGSSSQASIASALGEYIERLQTNNFFIEFYLPQRKYYPDQVAFDFGGDYLNKKLLAFYDPHGELEAEDLVDYNSDDESQIVALPFSKLSSEDSNKNSNKDSNERSSTDTVYFPLNLLSNLYLSNGLATGNTPLEAQVQGLCEILERYVKIEIIKNGYALPKYPEEIVQSFPGLQSDVEALRKSGYIVEVLDASLGGQYPVTAISLLNPKNSTLFVSFGAHPLVKVSLERTMTELMQGRDLDNLDSFDSFETPTFAMDLVADSGNIESHFINSSGKLGMGFLSTQKQFAYQPWSYEGSGVKAEHQFLLSILQDMGHDVYLREYQYLGFYSCQIIVPGVSEVYPVEDLIYNNRNRGKWIRKMVLHFQEYQPEDVLETIESLDDSIEMDKYIGVIFENPFTMQDFKVQLHLLLNQKEEALSYLEFSSNPFSVVLAEVLRLQEDELDWADYEEGLFNLFGQENVERALRILSHEDYLIDTTLHRDYHNILAMYDRLESSKKKAMTAAETTE